MWALKRTALGRSWLTLGRGSFLLISIGRQTREQFLGVLPEHLRLRHWQPVYRDPRVQAIARQLEGC